MYAPNSSFQRKLDNHSLQETGTFSHTLTRAYGSAFAPTHEVFVSNKCTAGSGLVGVQFTACRGHSSAAHCNWYAVKVEFAMHICIHKRYKSSGTTSTRHRGNPARAGVFSLDREPSRHLSKVYFPRNSFFILAAEDLVSLGQAVWILCLCWAEIGTVAS